MATASETEVAPVAGCPRLLVRRIEALADPESAFVHIYGASRDAFWLDSSAGGERGRFSFMGDCGGPLGALVSYDVEAGQVRVERGEGVELRDESIFEYLDRELRRLRPPPGDLPFDFDCGFVGYFGYELKAECGATRAHRSPTPDATFILADRLIAFDHQERHTYLLCLTPPHPTPTPTTPQLHQIFYRTDRKFDAVRGGGGDGGDGSGAGEDWIEETARRLQSLPAPVAPELGGAPAGGCRLGRSRRQYLVDIAKCQRYLTAGHSYEICLTNKVLAGTAPEPLALYRTLRRVNPAPHSAYLRFGDLAVLSSSPERFLAVDREGWAESRPIKGTCRRGETAAEDARLASALGSDRKSRAENVTIVDLVRNDLGRVCEVGTVSVPELMRVEAYETVHQLVSSVRGRLRQGAGAVECIRACFPPGSMTGAPKLRTMEILDQLEGEARGVYSGAIGYLGLGGGCDLSVAIRTIVVDGDSVAVGAGGAIVVDSDPEAEFEEMLLKARAQVAALAPDGTAPISLRSSSHPDPEQEKWP